MNVMSKKVAKTIGAIADGIESGSFAAKKKVALTLLGSEHGTGELLKAAKMAAERLANVEVVVIGDAPADCGLTCHPAADLNQCHKTMEELFNKGEIDGCVTLHYNFPFGVSTVGKVVTPAAGREMVLATTTGSSARERSAAMIKNTLAGIAAAKACGNSEPTVGILNLDSAATVARILGKLADNGYSINFAESARADGGVTMRGNDLLQGTPDIMVSDTLTGNLLIKVFSSFTTGGGFEAHGYGYGPGIGEGYDNLVMIISRASGAPVIANAIAYCAELAGGRVMEVYRNEMKKARQAGLEQLLKDLSDKGKSDEKAEAEVAAPPEKITDEEIGGIDILEIEEAKTALWKSAIYAKTGMGCTGPVVMVAAEDHDKAKEALAAAGYI